MAEVLTMPRPEGLVDAEERARALDGRRSWLVEAPAGSGKTGLLVQRYLSLLGGEDVAQPEQVLAITFTRAATEEMRARIVGELRAAEARRPVKDAFGAVTRGLAERALERSRERGWGLLEEPERLRLRTIDGLCAELVRAQPVLSGGGGGLRPVEDARPLYRQAARRTFLRLGDDGEPRLDAALRVLLLHRDGDLQKCEDLLAEMLGTRDQWSELIPLRPEELTDEVLETTVRPRLDRSLEQVVCAGLARLTAAMGLGLAERLAELAREMSGLERYDKAKAHPFGLCRELLGAPAADAALLPVWREMLQLALTQTRGWRAGFASNHIGVVSEKGDKARLKELVLAMQDRPGLQEAICAALDLPPARYPEAQWEVAKALFVVLGSALGDLQDVFREEGACDFVDGALRAQAVLRQGEGEPELRHLLVDEVQDTSTRQFHLLELLTRGWTGEGRTVFLVGDPKQSIYLFRQARVERFEEAMRSARLGSVELEVLRLRANFRSQAGLVRGFNEDFREIFGAAETGGGYSDAVPARSFSEDSRGAVWEMSRLSAEMDGEAKRAAREREQRVEARRIREAVETWRERQVNGREARAAVLVRRRPDLLRVVEELRREPAVPFRAVEIDKLQDRREVLDLLALTRAALSPADRVAWLAVLRAPGCGLSLRDLHVLTGSDDARLQERTVPMLVEERGQEISEDGIARLQQAWPALELLATQAGRLRTPELVERVWRALGYDRVLDGAERENAAAFLRTLRALDAEEGTVRLGELERRLERLYAEPDGGPCAVELVTMHGAKGLEWDVVFLPELNRRPKPAAKRLLEWEELPEGGVVLAPVPGKGEDGSELHGWISSLRAAREAAERRRLFYVAATRAREELHLYGVIEEGKKETKAVSGSLMEAAWPAAVRRLAEARAVPWAETPGVVEALAAEAEDVPVLLERIPAAAMAGEPRLPERNDLREGAPWQPGVGSLAARAAGRAAHALLEHMADRLQQGTAAAALEREVGRWRPRVAALLRANGVQEPEMRRAVRDVERALQGTLASAAGRWLLEQTNGAENEMAVTAADVAFRRVRMDRIFRAGEVPMTPGGDVLWIVDYKLADPGGREVEAFLKEEQQRYRPQLEGYAEMLAPAGPVRLALWFPLAHTLVWWGPERTPQMLREPERASGQMEIFAEAEAPGGRV